MKPLIAILLVGLMSTSSFFVFAQDCPAVKLTDFPPGDLPKRFDTALLKAHPSSDYYYGVGVPTDYRKARELAFIEMKKDTGNNGPFEGTYILLMLYANGYGVKRNLDLCIRLACGNINGAEAEVEGRAAHLKAMQSDPKPGKFDICDDITSGYMEGFCASLVSEKTAAKRKISLDSLLKGWPPTDQKAYNTLRKEAGAFFDARVMNEVDASGTARVAMEDGEDDNLEEGFLDQLRTAARCGFQPSTLQDFTAADKKLNTLYEKLMRNWQNIGTITKDGVRDTQREWIRYRDAWVAFAALRCPSISAESIKTMLTNERIAQLSELADLL